MIVFTNSKKNFYFLFFLVSAQFYGQKDIRNVTKTDTTYIKDLANKLIIKLFVDDKVDSYNLTQKSTNEIFNIRPNSNSKITASLDYESIAFSLSVPKKWSPFKPDNELKGKTKDISFSLGFFVNKWYQNFHFSDTKGYYIYNTEDLISDWQHGSDPYLQLPNYRVRKFEGSTAYIFNGNHFSYRSFLYQTQIQKKSAGSFILNLSFLYLYNSNDEKENNYTYNSNIFTISAIPAYQYNWVLSPHFTFSAGVNMGIGFRNSNQNYYEDNDKEKVNFNSLSKTLGINAYMNYQNNNLFCGLKGIASGTTANIDTESSINNSIFYGMIYLGYRFVIPSQISKIYNKI